MEYSFMPLNFPGAVPCRWSRRHQTFEIFFGARLRKRLGCVCAVGGVVISSFL